MEQIKNYRILDKLAETRGSIIYRGLDEKDSRSVIIKAMKAVMPTPSEVARFKQEFEIIKSICMDSVIKIYDMIEENGNFYFILEDFNGVSFKTLLDSKKRFDLKSFLKISVKIAETLGSLHMNNIVHRDIKPHNILINVQSGKLKITDFGISAVITHENDEVYHPEFITGTLSYMSPEQTGRINRTADYRTDLYSLGITLYEMLTGHLPFISRDPMELIHSHIAVMPVPPSEKKPGIPETVSKIIMKLLAKTPEDRYQNGFGVMHDLKECLKQLEKAGEIKNFELARNDISNRFIIPDQLFGRDKEIEALLKGFEYITGSEKGASVMVVTGAPGIGKSALINEIQKPIVAKRGYFISGKYELFQKDKPYNGIIQAFQSLVRQILSESEEMIGLWKKNLSEALQSNGRIITDVIPDIELIIGKQPEPAVLGPEETKNRFNFIFEKFTNLFPSAEHPVVLFLDDLQWADLASLQLLKNIITSPGIKNFYLILSFRDSDVNSFHPIMEFLKDAERNNIPVGKILLGPINGKDVKNLIVNFLKCSFDRGSSLAEIVHKKTGGNPFFVNQFLHVLYNEKLIVPDVKLGWIWDTDTISNMQITDNLVEMMSSKIGRLSKGTQEILKICSCIGNRFDLETLARVRESSIDKALSDLKESIDEGLISPYGKFYIFHHDRIHEAAYSMVTDSEKARLHYRIGRFTLGSAGDRELQGNLFYIVDQLNLGSEIATTPERIELAALNLEAGKKAKQSAAYSPAIIYLDYGIKYLEEKSWHKHYPLALALYTQSAETAYLMGDYKKMNELADTVIRNARSTLDKAEVYITKIHAFIAQEQFSSAIDSALPILNQLGIRFKKNPTQLHLVFEFIRTMKFIRRKSPDYFFNLPVMTDPEKLAASRIITSMSHAAFYADPNLIGMTIFKSFYTMSRYGHAPDHVLSLIGLAFILAAQMNDFTMANEYGDMGLKLLNKLDAKRIESQAVYSYNALFKHWTGNLKDTIEPLNEGYRTGMETGVLGFAGFNLFFKDIHSLYSGVKGSEVNRMMAATNRIIAGLNQKHLLTQQALSWQGLMNLLGECRDYMYLRGSAIDAEKLVPLWVKTKNSGALASYWYAKVLCGIYYNDYRLALKSLNMFQKYKHSMQNIIINRFIMMHDSIVRLLLFSEFSAIRKKSVKKTVKSNLKKLKKIASIAPDNVIFMISIIEGLYEWQVHGNSESSIKKINEAIHICRKNEDYLHEGLFNEFAVKFHIVSGNEKKAVKHLTASYSAFMKWGSAGIVNRLANNYPYLAQPPSSKDETDPASDSGSSTTGTGTKSLDISTVLKASQAISGEIVLDKLLERMLRIVIENAGAERGFMILEDKGVLLVEAEGKIDRSVSVMKSIPIESHEGLSSAIVNLAARKKETIILSNASTEGDFVNDPYILKNRPKSILCSAILNQGKLSCIIYMENNLSSGAFTPQRLEILNILSSQIAISIDNAKLYETLEEKVRERTEDLYTANSELEAANERLTETNRQLKHAQRIAERDMAIATRVQSSLFPAESPENDEWDTAFVFRAMSGVSGDLYDFYEQDGELKGVLVMDVSGHGIASGLITTIARSVFQRNFENGSSRPLKEIMNRANTEMINEIGNVDNYLTGVLLRFSGSQVEFVNAAHPDFFIKNGRTGEVLTTTEYGCDVKGDIIGEVELAKDYADCNFNIQGNDTILLYTDCLYEGKNPDGEEYGTERVRESFSGAPDGTPQEILDHILKDYYRFIERENLSDDLTLIVLKKKR